jgi:long-chain acyl-CoA synthetase
MTQDAKNRIPSIHAFYSLKPPGGSFRDISSLMDNPGDFKPADVGSEDGLAIIHTAAVAGKPRGALLCHRNLICSNIHLGYSMQISAEDVHLNLLPLFHVAGLFMTTMSFHSGALNINMSKFDALQAVELIEEKKVSVFFDFAPVLSSILEHQKQTGKDLHTLRAVTGIDTPQTIENYQKVTGGTFYPVYGQTEVSGFTTFGRYNDRPGSAGKMLQMAQVRLMDDKDNPVSIGEIGEITVKGQNVFKGYWKLPEDTGHAFRGGWHHTGDLGRFDPDGFLWYEGRKAEKELIKPGGENVYPAEVERVILEHPSVDNVVVFGVPDPKWKEGIKAVCCLKAGANLDPNELIQFVGERIARYKKPQYVEVASDFPLLKDGSPDRAKIKELYGGK